MQLNSLQIFNLRNLASVDLNLNSHLNIFWGKNGGGKTSLLEAIYLLAMGRSFRTAKPQQTIRFGEKSCVISGVVSTKVTVEENNLLPPIRLGIERFHTGSPKIRLAEQDCHSIVELARVLPIQLINSSSYDILEANPQVRRQFLDWLMFHVEHSFHTTWQRFKRALAQRNAALKSSSQLSLADIRVWDKEFIDAGEQLDKARLNMVEQFIPEFLEIVGNLLKIKGQISVRYCRGWDEKMGLAEALDRVFLRDKEWGHTTLGPQKADLEFLLDKVPAKNVLSRGQSKLFVCALLMARAQFLLKKNNRRCVFLIDDLNSELDMGAATALVESIYKWGGQVLITNIEDKPIIKILNGKDHSMFHVEHGQISPL
jgi:DNA replication and repair protein RecF